MRIHAKKIIMEYTMRAYTVLIYHLYTKNSFMTCYGHEHHDTTHQKILRLFRTKSLMCLFQVWNKKVEIAMPNHKQTMECSSQHVPSLCFVLTMWCLQFINQLKQLWKQYDLKDHIFISLLTIFTWFVGKHSSEYCFLH